jgi:hypothetical protein
MIPLFVTLVIRNTVLTTFFCPDMLKCKKNFLSNLHAVKRPRYFERHNRLTFFDCICFNINFEGLDPNEPTRVQILNICLNKFIEAKLAQILISSNIA